MVKPSALQILVLSIYFLLFNCAILNAGAIENDNQKTAYDFYLSGNASYRNGDCDKAISDFRKSVELDPDYYYARINLGVALAGVQKLEEAIQEFTFCIDKKWGSEADRFPLQPGTRRRKGRTDPISSKGPRSPEETRSGSGRRASQL
jgi:hypothetical protein